MKPWTSLRCALALTLTVAVMAVALPGRAWRAEAAAAPVRPLIFVPGLLGSRLCRADPAGGAGGEPNVVWGTLGALSAFPTLRLEPGTSDQAIKPCGLLRQIVYLGLFTQQIYAPVVAHLERLGYREGRNLFVFDYDWRRSVFDNAAALAAFVREKIPDETQQFDILAHSMGGLVSRVYVGKLGGSARTARLFSAGTPFFGSVKVYETLEQGWGAANYLMGGLTEFRRTMLSFPSAYELMPRYDACCSGGVGGAPSFVPANIDAWRALAWEGIDSATMPDLTATFARVEELRDIIAKPLPPTVEDVLLVGVDQRTPHRVAFEQAGPTISTRVVKTWAGDGTVVRESAALARAPVRPTSFADHEKILHDPQIQQFLAVALTRSVSDALREVPIRPRDKVRMRDGKVTELVGIAIVADQPMYRAGEKGKVHVHVRLATKEPLARDKIRVVLHAPDGRRKAIAMKSDPAASEPTNPFEQTFGGRFDVGTDTGTAILKVTIAVTGAQPRVAERSFAVMAP
jgi:pimeloyl-ACP methyl ester carboxylesterase